MTITESFGSWEHNDGGRAAAEILLAFAKDKPPGDSEVREKLLQWLEETRVPENSETPSIKYVEVALMQLEIKFKLGFLSGEDAISELNDIGLAINSETGDTDSLKDEWHKLYAEVASTLP